MRAGAAARNPLEWWRGARQRLWAARPEELPAAARPALRVARLVFVLARDLASGRLTLHAMGLVYTTLLSLVPLLALSFSVLKAFGVHNQVRPLLDNFLAPLGPGGERLAGQIVGFIERVNVGVLGSLGLALLLYTVVSLMQKIEGSFNFVWHVTAPRPMGERFTRYLSALLVGPLLVFAALGSTAMLMNSAAVRYVLEVEPLGEAALVAGRLMPYAVTIAAFTFLYMFIPNTRVRFGPALAAGVVAGALWQTGGWAFAQFATSSTRYAAIYSGFAILVLFMIWLYLGWLILLVGASVAFYTQHPAYLVGARGEPRLSNRLRERLALGLMARVAQRYRDGGAPLRIEEMSSGLGVPMHVTQPIIDALVQGGALAPTADDPPAFLPARDLRALTVAELLALVRAAGEERFLTPESLPAMPAVEDAVERYENAMRTALGDIDVASLAGRPA